MTRTGVMIALAVLVVAFRMLWGETVHEWSVILIVVLLLFAAAMVRSETREENNGDDRADD